ncbi:aromatic ring-hydroxylating dioxygenase subunit alpha, partial [Streptomyces sp. NPDC056728]
MTEALPRTDGYSADGPAGFPQRPVGERGEAVADLRRIGIDPDYWYPVAVSRAVRKERTFAAVFAGERIALYRGRSGSV